MDFPVTHKQKRHAETLFKVMIKSKYDVMEIAGVLNHMGAMLREYAKELDKDSGGMVQ
jgi:hypothetical protein